MQINKIGSYYNQTFGNNKVKSQTVNNETIDNKIQANELESKALENINKTRIIPAGYKLIEHPTEKEGRKFFNIAPSYELKRNENQDSKITYELPENFEFKTTLTKKPVARLKKLTDEDYKKANETRIVPAGFKLLFYANVYRLQDETNPHYNIQPCGINDEKRVRTLPEGFEFRKIPTGLGSYTYSAVLVDKTETMKNGYKIK